MADPISATAAAASVMTGGLKIAEGFSQRNMMRQKAKAAEIDAKYAALRSVQVAGQKREEMNDVISAVNSIRVGRGVGLDSATGRAIRADARKRGGQVKRQSVLNELLGRDRSRAAASGYRSGAAAAPWVGFAKALPSFLDAAGQAMGGGGSAGGGKD